MEGEAVGSMGDDGEAAATLTMVERAESVAAHRPIAFIGAIGIVIVDRAVLVMVSLKKAPVG
jgi:hypothetical protein